MATRIEIETDTKATILGSNCGVYSGLPGTVARVASEIKEWLNAWPRIRTHGQDPAISWSDFNARMNRTAMAFGEATHGDGVQL